MPKIVTERALAILLAWSAACSSTSRQRTTEGEAGAGTGGAPLDAGGRAGSSGAGPGSGGSDGSAGAAGADGVDAAGAGTAGTGADAGAGAREVATRSAIPPEPHHLLTRECIEAARAIHNRDGKRARVRGLFFYQGETDAALAAHWNSTQVIDNWPVQYAEVIEFLRDEFGEVPAVHAQIASVVNSDPNYQKYWRLLQEAQATVPNRLSRSAMIVTKDLQIHDGIHLNDASQAIAGQRFAGEMSKLLP